MTNTDKIKKILDRHFCICIYLFALFLYSYLLFSARNCGLLPFPYEGMDQYRVIVTAADMYHGKMPSAGYLLSPLYTLFIYVLVVLSQGNLIIMRLLQAALCALTPVLIFKLTRKIRMSKESAKIAAFLYCFYGAAALVTLSFLRAGPLAFCFVLFAFFLVKAFIARKLLFYLFAGAVAALCVLGRESFLPVVLAPVIFMFFPKIRKHIKPKFIVAFISALILVILPFSLYNFIRFQSFAIIPGALENIFTIFHGEKTARVSLDSSLFNSILVNMPIQFFKFLSSYEIPNSLSFYAHKEIIDFMAIFVIPFNLLMGFAIVGGVFYRKNKGVLCLALLIASFCASMLFFNMLYRYRVPVVPIVCVLAAVGITKMVHLKPIKKKIVPIIFLLLFFMLTYTSPDKLRPVSERLAVAKYLISIKQYYKAENYLKELDKDNIKTEKLYPLLINALKQEGEEKMAEYIHIEWEKSLKSKSKGNDG